MPMRKFSIYQQPNFKQSKKELLKAVITNNSALPTSNCRAMRVIDRGWEKITLKRLFKKIATCHGWRGRGTKPRCLVFYSLHLAALSFCKQIIYLNHASTCIHYSMPLWFSVLEHFQDQMAEKWQWGEICNGHSFSFPSAFISTGLNPVNIMGTLVNLDFSDTSIWRDEILGGFNALGHGQEREHALWEFNCQLRTIKQPYMSHHNSLKNQEIVCVGQYSCLDVLHHVPNRTNSMWLIWSMLENLQWDQPVWDTADLASLLAMPALTCKTA